MAVPMIRIEQNDTLLTVVLDNPRRRNAIPRDGWTMLAEGLAVLPDATRAVLLTSETPGIFSAGADLSELARLHEDAAERVGFRQAMRAGIDALAACAVPTIAAIDGGCHGAGVALALACDWRIGGPGARFAIPPARLGIGYPPADVARLIATVGRGQAARLLFTAETIDADEALRIGLVEQQASSAVEAARAEAQAIANLSPHAVRLLKRTWRDPHTADGDARFDAAFGGPDFARGVAAFLESSR